MSDQWYERFVEAVRASPKSMREISLGAGCGPNYVEQTISRRSHPQIDKFMRIMGQIGTASALYVLTGIEVTAEDEEFLRVVTSFPPEVRAEALRFFLALQESAGKP